KRGGKWGYIDREENVIIPFIYEDAGSFSDGLASVKLDGKWGFINKDNIIIVPFLFNDASNFFNGTSRVEKGGKSGYIIKESANTNSTMFQSVIYVTEGLRFVSKRIEAERRTEDMGYIDKNGRQFWED